MYRRMSHPRRFGYVFSLVSLALSPLVGQCDDVRMLPQEGKVSSQKAPRDDRFAFAGEPQEIRCLVGGKAKVGLGKVVLDIHRVAGSTAVPISEKEIPFAPAGAADATTIELIGPFEIPETRVPSKYLVRLLNEFEGKRAPIASLMVHAIPNDHAPGVSGRVIKAVGFDPATREWAEVFSRGGASIEWVETFPSSLETADWIFAIKQTAARQRTPGDLRPGQLIVYFDNPPEGDSAPRVDRVETSPEKGRIITLPLSVLNDAAKHAASRARMFGLLSEIP